jgi:hypothetical protein
MMGANAHEASQRCNTDDTSKSFHKMCCKKHVGDFTACRSLQVLGRTLSASWPLSYSRLHRSTLRPLFWPSLSSAAAVLHSLLLPGSLLPSPGVRLVIESLLQVRSGALPLLVLLWLHARPTACGLNRPGVVSAFSDSSRKVSQNTGGRPPPSAYTSCACGGSPLLIWRDSK